MNEQQKQRIKARLPRGFRDRPTGDSIRQDHAFSTIVGVYKRYGFEALETPALEYTDALGKFLPDQDRPNEGVFSLQDDDDQWLSLRYDLTAPLARYVAENFQNLPKPFRRFQYGTVWRNEKPGPGRFREFIQFDADTVGSASPAADAELLVMFADVLKEFHLDDECVIKVSNRKLLDGVLQVAGISAESESKQRGIVLRALDKLDRIGPRGVRALLGQGRKDESGDFTEGAKLSENTIEQLMAFLSHDAAHNDDLGLAGAVAAVQGSRVGEAGVNEIEAILRLVRSCGYDRKKVQFDPGIVRGLDYYTGAIFEAQPTFAIKNEDGETITVGSLGGGGRYDDLVERFTGQHVPATGISVGVSRLLSVLKYRGLTAGQYVAPLVVVLALDKSDHAASFSTAQEIREGLKDLKGGLGVRAEAYVGEAGMKAQLKYADKRRAKVVVIEGADERARGEVTLKNLALGAELAKATESREAWIKDRPAQTTVKRDQLVQAVRAMLGERGG